jgi:hypothetical protein
MKSDGGFDRSSNVKASQLLLSGPAGGLIGCKSIINIFEDIISAPVNSTLLFIKILSVSIWAALPLIFLGSKIRIFPSDIA